MSADQTQAGAGMRWILRMAWRDSRGQRKLLLLFTLCVVFGVAALVSINSLRANLERIIDLESRQLLGADLMLQARQPFSAELREFMRELDGRVSEEIRFRSMAVFPELEAADRSRLVQARALKGDFPFYGALETEPVDAVQRLRAGEPVVLVESALLAQFGVEPGDTVRLGEKNFEIAGALERVAGESELAGFFAPRVYLPLRYIEETGLVQQGSIVRHRAYLAFDGGLTADRSGRIAEARDSILVEEGVRATTVEDRRERVGEVLENIFNFLNLVGFIALLLGGIGVGGAVQVYLKRKLETVALLRCLGCRQRTAFAIYLLQVMAVGFVGAALGAVLGVCIQFLLPVFLGDFLPVDVELRVSPSSIAAGLVFGWLVATLFAFVPLLSVRKVSPLTAIRADVENPHTLRRDPWFWVVVFLMALVTVGYCLARTTQWIYGLGFAAGLGASLLLLATLAWVLRGTLRRFAPARGSYLMRLALSNLYRPNNRTLFLVVTLGMGAFLVTTLYLVRASLLSQVQLSEPGAAANVILLDVQRDQVEGVRGLLEAESMGVRDVLPIVTMRVAAIKGRSVSEIRRDPESKVESWVYTWEFRNTYRDHVLDNARIQAGEFIGRYDGPEPIPVSIADNLLEDLQVGLGDAITWNVQGVQIETYVASIREIDWRAERQNFGIVFPLGTIEEAPTVFAVTTNVAGREQTTRLQTALADRFSNVSLLDLTLVFETVNKILDKAAFVIQFMAGFTIFTGLIVLAGAVLTSRYQRMRESVLLRTLGASGSFIRRLLAAEFVILGVLAALAGVTLSVVAAGILIRFVFETDFVVDFPILAIISGALVLLTLLTGLSISRGIAAHPPLTILRDEG